MSILACDRLVSGGADVSSTDPRGADLAVAYPGCAILGRANLSGAASDGSGVSLVPGFFRACRCEASALVIERNVVDIDFQEASDDLAGGHRRRPEFGTAAFRHRLSHDRTEHCLFAWGDFEEAQ